MTHIGFPCWQIPLRSCGAHLMTLTGWAFIWWTLIAAAAEEKSQLVEDVHKFPGHIACDVASNSEVVVPLKVEGSVVGVLDIDSPTRGRFGEEELLGLEVVAGKIEQVVEFERFV